MSLALAATECSASRVLGVAVTSVAERPQSARMAHGRRSCES